MAVEIENVERLRRQLRKDKEELEMWKQTCDHLENGKRLNKIYERALQNLINGSEREKEFESESSPLPKAIRQRYDDLLSDGKELLRITDKVLENEYNRLDNEDLESKQESDRQDMSHPQTRAKSSNKVKPEMTPVREIESHSNTTIMSDNSFGNKSARSQSRGIDRSPPRSRAERREQSDRPWSRSFEEYLEKTPRQVHLSGSLDRSWSRASSRKEKTCESGREILIGDHPWGGKIRREKTWCCPGRDKNKKNMTREEKRINRERPWVLSKEKKAILRQSTFYDLPMTRTETAFRNQPKTRARSEMKHYDSRYDRPETRADKKKQVRPPTRSDHVTPQHSDLSPRGNRKPRMAGREVSFSLTDDIKTQNNVNDKNQGPLTRSLDTPLTYYNISLEEPLNNEADDSKTRPDTRIDYVSPLQLGESLNLGRRSPGSGSPSSLTEAWFTPRSKPTEREISIYKSPDLAIAEVEASNKPPNQFIPKKKVMKRPRHRTTSKEERSLDRYGGTMASWSTVPHGPRPHSTAEGLEGPIVWQLKPRETRPHTRGNPLENSARENNSTKRH